jgi:hypothetical protein
MNIVLLTLFYIDSLMRCFFYFYHPIFILKSIFNILNFYNNPEKQLNFYFNFFFILLNHTILLFLINSLPKDHRIFIYSLPILIILRFSLFFPFFLYFQLVNFQYPHLQYQLNILK